MLRGSFASLPWEPLLREFSLERLLEDDPVEAGGRGCCLCLIARLEETRRGRADRKREFSSGRSSSSDCEGEIKCCSWSPPSTARFAFGCKGGWLDLGLDLDLGLGLRELVCLGR